MRTALILPLVLACGIALPALAEPATPTAAIGAKVDGPLVQSKTDTQAEDAAKALAMSIRQREIEEQRIARIACAAGDTSKCQLVKAETTSSTPSP